MRSSPRRRFSSPRSSPRKLPNSPKTSSRLPIRSLQNSIARFSIKDLRLPPDDSITNNNSSQNNTGTKVTPEKLMEELREEVKKKQQRRIKAIDEEISLSIPFTGLEVTDDSSRPRMSLRNRCPVMVDAPDLVYEDPLEVARQTLQNTRANTGYRHIKLIYTTERRSVTRSRSPEPAFSRKKGIRRHLLKLFEDDKDEGDRDSCQPIPEGKLRFERVLKLFEDEEGEGFAADEVDFAVNLDAKPGKSCLKLAKQAVQSEYESLSQITAATTAPKARIVQIKRICYDGSEDEREDVASNKSSEPPDSPSKKRRLSSGNGAAKRLKKPEE